MKLKKFALATTALTIIAGAAYADSNTLFLDQSGSNNVADVDQSHGSGGNDIGLSTGPALQDGDGNKLVYDNTLYASGSNNDIVSILQDGDDNDMLFRDWNNAHNNVTSLAKQIGDNNYLRASHNGGDDNVLSSVIAEGDSNDITIDQSGKFGEIQSVRITGSNNGNNGSHVNNQNWGIRISQGGGNNNIIRDATIEGDNNTGLAGYGYFDDPSSSALRGTAMRITQSGNTNDANSTMLGSNGNAILIHQDGDDNIGDVAQGLTVGSTGNAVKMIQTGNTNNGSVLQAGSYNIAHITQDGSSNFIGANQYGDSNTLMATFVGSGNGIGMMSGVAGDLEGSNMNLAQGTVLQDSSMSMSGNLISYNVNGNNNLFAFAQIGSANLIEGSVGSNGNQVAVLQTGSGNGTTFTQNGGSNNNISVTQ